MIWEGGRGHRRSWRGKGREENNVNTGLRYDSLKKSIKKRTVNIWCTSIHPNELFYWLICLRKSLASSILNAIRKCKGLRAKTHLKNKDVGASELIIKLWWLKQCVPAQGQIDPRNRIESSGIEPGMDSWLMTNVTFSNRATGGFESTVYTC